MGVENDSNTSAVAVRHVYMRPAVAATSGVGVF